MKQKPSAILFDMDGVLIESLDSWWLSLNDAFKAYNHKEISRDEFIEKYWGHDLSYNLEKMGIDYKILKFCNTAYSNHTDSVKIFPDTKSTLENLTKYKKGIITNTPKDCAKQVLGKHNLEKYFDVIVTVDEVSRGKPSPELVYKACEYLNVEPKETVLVGDTDNDIIAGKAAGCIVVGINIEGDYTIKKLSDLTKLIENLNNV
jgi:pyrophosphatase PpaX